MAKKKKKKIKKKTTQKAPAYPLATYIDDIQKQYEPIIKEVTSRKKILDETAARIIEARKSQKSIMESASRPLASAIAARQEILDRYNNIIGVNQFSEDIDKESEEFVDELIELRKFIPIELNPTTQDYINKLLDNMGANSNFYNNAVLNLSHFYIFCLHSLMVKVYRNAERFKHLQYLKEITKKPEKCELNLKNLGHSIFNRIEPEAVIFLFYYLGIDSHSHIFQCNNDIFDARHEIAHFNEKVFSYDKYQDVRNLIESNLKELFQKAYKYMKESLCAEIIEYNNAGSLDDQSYDAIFEEINQRYYITHFDYELLADRLTSRRPKTNYYILKYAIEQLGIEKQ